MLGPGTLPLALRWLVACAAGPAGPAPGSAPAPMAARVHERCRNGVDDDLDGAADCADPDCALACDRDNDGHPYPEDCDDHDPRAYPGAPVVCDGALDNDCDGRVDPLHVDHDGDGRSWCDGDCDELLAVSDVEPPVDRYACAWCPSPAEVLALEDAWVERLVDPCALDPEAGFRCEEGEEAPRLHLLLHRDDIPLRRETLVFFPPAEGRNNDRLRRFAAGAGYKTVSLAYWNDGLPEDACNAAGGDCWERVRTEILTGLDTWPGAEVRPADSIVGRLEVLFNHLAEAEPDLGWDRHLGDLDPASGRRALRWEELVLAGYSEGSGNPPFIARRHRVRAALMISGPFDADQTDPLGAPAPWVLEPGPTPACAFWGLRHAEEGYRYMAQVWTGLGIAEAPVLVEASSPPYDGSHWLETALRRSPDCPAHRCTAVDNCLHQDLAPAYLHLFCRAAAPCD